MATTAEPQPTTSEADDRPTTAKGWGTDAPDQPLRPMEFERRALRPDDVAIKITYAGICHCDLHTCRNDWGGTPLSGDPGPRDRRHRHRASATKSPATASATRSRSAAWSTAAWSATSASKAGKCFCRKGCVQTYNSADYHDGTITQGRLHRPYRRARPFRAARCPRAWTSAGSRRCCAPASRPTRRFANIMSGPAPRWRSSASAASATWASSSARRWARM